MSLGALLAFAATPAEAALSPEQIGQLPPAAARPVDFARDIQPIFEASCTQCHARGKSKGSFSLETREDFLTGGDSGPGATPGRSATSLVIETISGLNPEIAMPKKGKKLTREQVSVFRAWIDQGMPWPKEIAFHKAEPANLRAVTPPTPPGGSRFENPIDAFVDDALARQGVAWGPQVDDRTYARRVWLDVHGALPPPEELEAFVAESAPGKRARLVTRLLGDDRRYAEHWLSFWNDLLRNDYKGTGYTDGGRKQITGWLYAALARNLPYDRMVAQLIDPGAEAEGFVNGILWRGAVNASMVPPMQAAQSIGQVFLGVNLKCTSCHDSFINEYTLKDAYGLAAVYADGPLEVAECDRPTGRQAKVKFLYEEIGTLDPAADPAARKRQLAALITGRSNGRLPRTIVNRLWQRFMGHGLVEPVDEMDKPAWSPALLDWLAEDLVANGFDLKRTMARILTSRAYQLPAAHLGETEENYVFRGPAARRLTAEQFVDAVSGLAGIGRTKLDGKLNRNAALSPAGEQLPLRPKWIWGALGGERKSPPATHVFRRVVTLAEKPSEAHAALAADDTYALKINGKAVASSARRNSVMTDWVDLKAHLKQGENTVEITVSNLPPDDGRLASFATDARPDPDSPAGLVFYARVRAGAAVMDFVSNREWAVLGNAKPPTNDRFAPPDNAPPADMGRAVELGGLEIAPWKLGGHFLDIAAAPRDTLPVERAALVSADPLMAALGRPNREQIVTTRPGAATTLQALELTNGATLAVLLTQVAERLIAETPAGGAAMIDTLYARAFGRRPSRTEAAVAEDLVGAPAKAEGVADLIWAMAMQPEFQLIR